MPARFMVLAAPRSGTTWAANWLMHEGEKCLHDPFMLGATPQDFDEHGLNCGISCTSAVIQYPDWVRSYKGPIVVLHKDFRDINESLVKLGLPVLDVGKWVKALAVDGLHVMWDDLFDPDAAAKIFTYLTGRNMDYHLHSRLRNMNVQPSRDIIEECKNAALVQSQHS